MPRFSSKCKEIFDVIHYYSDIKRAEKLTSLMSDPLDIAFGKGWNNWYYGNLREYNKLLANLSEMGVINKDRKDKFLQFIIDSTYCMYYIGWFADPIVDRKLAEEYRNSYTLSYHEIDFKDDWEEYFIKGWYYTFESAFSRIFQGKLSEPIELQKIGNDKWVKMGKDGEYLANCFGAINVGWYSWTNGIFDGVERYFLKSIDAIGKYNNLWELWAWINLAYLTMQKGELDKAREYNDKVLEKATKFENNILISLGYATKGGYYFAEGLYGKAIEMYHEALKYLKRTNKPLRIFWGYFEIFEIYNEWFKITQDKVHLQSAEDIINDNLLPLLHDNPDNKMIDNFTTYCQALILKYGNIRKKGEAINMLEKLLEIYPTNLTMSYELLELLFEDILVSEDPETIIQIDKLMDNIKEMPLRNNPQAVFGFVSQQIFLAKYNYFIKGDPNFALKILNSALDRIRAYKLEFLEHRLETEIQNLEKELTKWEDVDVSIKDRIKNSGFQKYIQEALKIADNRI
ncbi:MAG: tetratricopeptide repeat protein [Candidatus Kariarchaeaceae archaeon]|jgi:tetratricopeptide (TPR) repeat protein